MQMHTRTIYILPCGYIIRELQTISPKLDFSLRTLQTGLNGVIFFGDFFLTWKVEKNNYFKVTKFLSSKHRVCSAYFGGDLFFPSKLKIQNIRHEKPDLDDKIRTDSRLPGLPMYASIFQLVRLFDYLDKLN
jgi:hypothetical protein